MVFRKPPPPPHGKQTKGTLLGYLQLGDTLFIFAPDVAEPQIPCHPRLSFLSSAHYLLFAITLLLLSTGSEAGQWSLTF